MTVSGKSLEFEKILHFKNNKNIRKKKTVSLDDQQVGWNLLVFLYLFLFFLLFSNSILYSFNFENKIKKKKEFDATCAHNVLNNPAVFLHK